MNIRRGLIALPWAWMAAVAPVPAGFESGSSQEIVAIETPTAPDSCTAPISVVGAMSVGANGAKISLINPSTVLADDSLRFEVIVNGVKRYVWTPLVLSPGRSMIASVRFLQPVSSPVITVCGNKPVAIVESPDPIVGMTPLPETEDPGQTEAPVK